MTSELPDMKFGNPETQIAVQILQHLCQEYTTTKFELEFQILVQDVIAQTQFYVTFNISQL